ncbi:hypothetical protein E0H92_26420 [Kribbella speibonae]|uniref:Uncharacterized protein n=1 Tax=Kribbella speibonae TaxID=1572660 RepID=A0A4R0IXC7_9ACTN|nr:hypothetical protein E0H92_26420 [Kribbella speibonae]
MVVGSVTAGGDVASKLVTVGAATADAPDIGVFPAGAVRVSGSLEGDPDVTGHSAWVGGYTVMGSSMYSTSYYLTLDGDVDRTRPTTYLVGGGWGDTTFFETTRFWDYPKLPNLTTQYQLRADGTLTRWEMYYNNGNNPRLWANKRSATGFAAVKTMAMISQTLTYDTFLANTRGGALYTIRIPRTSPMKPIVKKVRGSTWQAFDALVAEKCGRYGTMVVGIDKDTQTAYSYAVGHANGTATVIQGLGKVPATFADPVYFRRQMRQGDAQMLFGE